MTGLWQVSGRSDVDYETRVYLDAWYVKIGQCGMILQFYLRP